jgi:predicted aldo/keto reductase-like oxidoreductase
MSSSETGLKRREFLERGLAATVGVGIAPFAALADDPPHVQRYAPLGKTGLSISDISFGSGTTSNPKVVRYAYDLGVNYFDTAESYPIGKPGRAGHAELAIATALRDVRNEVVIGSKTEAPRDARVDALMNALEQSLRRLGTDRIDLYFNHAVNDLARLRNPEWFEFVERAKKQGKIRFSGVSGHGGHLVEVLDAALDEDLVDVILAAHNFGQDPAFYEKFTKGFDFVAKQPELPRVMKKAHEQGVGFIAMKTRMGARLNDMSPWNSGGATAAQAAFRWVLSGEYVDALVVTMKSRAEVAEFIAASGSGSPTANDVRLLERHLTQHGGDYCRHGCDACSTSCPEGVEIPEVLRTRMYASHYRDGELARSSYARITGDASACVDCAHQACAGTCPYGLDISGLTLSTPRLLRTC